MREKATNTSINFTFWEVFATTLISKLYTGCYSSISPIVYLKMENSLMIPGSNPSRDFK